MRAGSTPRLRGRRPVVAVVGAALVLAACAATAPIEAERADRIPSAPATTAPATTVPAPAPQPSPTTIPRSTIPPRTVPSTTVPVATDGAPDDPTDPRSRSATVQGLLSRDPSDRWTEYPPVPVEIGAIDRVGGARSAVILAADDDVVPTAHTAITPNGSGGAILYGARQAFGEPWRAAIWDVDASPETGPPLKLTDSAFDSVALSGAVTAGGDTVVAGVEHRTPGSTTAVVWRRVGGIGGGIRVTDLPGGDGAVPRAVVESPGQRLFVVATVAGEGGAVLVWSAESGDDTWSGPGRWDGDYWGGATATVVDDRLMVLASHGWRDWALARFAVVDGAPVHEAAWAVGERGGTADLAVTPSGAVVMTAGDEQAELRRLTVDGTAELIEQGAVERGDRPVALSTIGGELVVVRAPAPVPTPGDLKPETLDVRLTVGLEAPRVIDTATVGWWQGAFRDQIATVGDELLLADMADRAWRTFGPAGGTSVRTPFWTYGVRNPVEDVVDVEVVGASVLAVVRTTDPYDERQPVLGARVVASSDGRVFDGGGQLAGDHAVIGVTTAGVVAGVSSGAQTDWYVAETPEKLAAGGETWLGSSPGTVATLALTSAGPVVSNTDGSAWSSSDFAEWTQVAEIRTWDGRRLIVHGVCGDGHLAIAVGHATGGDTQNGRVMIRAGDLWVPVASLDVAYEPTLDTPMRCSFADGEFAAVYEERDFYYEGYYGLWAYRGRFTAALDDYPNTFDGIDLTRDGAIMSWTTIDAVATTTIVAADGSVVAGNGRGLVGDTDTRAWPAVGWEPPQLALSDGPGDQTVGALVWHDGGLVVGGSDGALPVVWLPAD